MTDQPRDYPIENHKKPRTAGGMSKSGWWKKDKRPGVKFLAYIFQLERADLIPLAVRKKRATKRGCLKHATRPAGSKLFKKYDRAKWVLKYKEGL